jgi:GTP cyclohydrolase I
VLTSLLLLDAIKHILSGSTSSSNHNWQRRCSELREKMQMQGLLEPQSLAEASLRDLIREMLVRLGEDPERDGLRQTAERRERSMQYLTKGHQEGPEETLLGAMFNVAYDEMVIVKDIEMFSLCEHHLLPFFGKVHVAYIPQGKVIGLSKVPRLVDVFADCRCRNA